MVVIHCTVAVFDVEFPHELWEQHRHHGFGENADEGERADRHDGADEFAGNAFVRRFA